ncbi:MAG: hypothetical protein KDK26_18400 [Roseivivax sp.]|nr:hypothetical protein [Roseivivax sp.]
MFDLQVPFFRPLWRRVATVLFALFWAGVEIVTGSPFWAMLFGGMGLYAAWEFFFAWKGGGSDDPDA